jgi:hypothetical protein
MASATPAFGFPADRSTAFGSFDSYPLHPHHDEPLACSLEELVQHELEHDVGFVAALLRGYAAQASALRAVLDAQRLGAAVLPPGLSAQVEMAQRATPAFLGGAAAPA